MDKTVGSSFAAWYPQLLALARTHLAREAGEPPSARTLVTGVYMDMQKLEQLRFACMEQFLKYVSSAFAHRLVDRARRANSLKRKMACTTLSKAAGVHDEAAGTPERGYALKQAMERLYRVNPRQARVVELRVIDRKDDASIARELGVSETTVERDWQAARAFIVALI